MPVAGRSQCSSCRAAGEHSSPSPPTSLVASTFPSPTSPATSAPPPQESPRAPSPCGGAVILCPLHHHRSPLDTAGPARWDPNQAAVAPICPDPFLGLWEASGCPRRLLCRRQVLASKAAPRKLGPFFSGGTKR